jgi:hypothetical protein
MNLVERVKAILLTPDTEWRAIEGEPGDASYLFSNYVAILAAIPAICGFVGTSLIGVTLPVAGTVRVPIITGIIAAIVGYLLAFVGVYVLALIVDALAPNFNGQKNFFNALKLAVYSATPAWLAGVFSLIPSLVFLGILGLYSVYLFYVGLPIMMRSPLEKTLVYTIAVIAVAIIISLLIGSIQASLIGIR